ALGAFQEKDAFAEAGVQHVLGGCAQGPAGQQSRDKRRGADETLRFQRVFHSSTRLPSGGIVVPHCGEKQEALQVEKQDFSRRALSAPGLTSHCRRMEAWSLP